ncbi:MAG: hypothetical protein J3K34DRAFT_431875 [Monoraphidium minutum]|nr:MAG: hypothetical protein J3K34DRAFT_431875 [Monoraphidium minutum]
MWTEGGGESLLVEGRGWPSACGCAGVVGVAPSLAAPTKGRWAGVKSMQCAAQAAGTRGGPHPGGRRPRSPRARWLAARVHGAGGGRGGAGRGIRGSMVVQGVVSAAAGHRRRSPPASAGRAQGAGRRAGAAAPVGGRGHVTLGWARAERRFSGKCGAQKMRMRPRSCW